MTFQTLMSVPWNLITVIQMHFVTILLEAIPVYVTLVSLEMGSLAQVSIETKHSEIAEYYSLFLDIDECEHESLNECDVNANCSNTVGSYSCFCLSGFEGNGFNCSGVSLSVDRKGR